MGNKNKKIIYTGISLNTKLFESALSLCLSKDRMSLRQLISIFFKNYTGAASILCLALFISCSSFQTNPLLKRESLVLRTISDTYYPSSGSSIRSEVLPPVKFPKWDKRTIINILGNIKFRREQLWGNTVDAIYSDHELQYMASSIQEGIKLMKLGERLLLINKYDPDTSILSKTHLNTALLWVDKAGVNLVFGVIHEEVPGDDFHDNQNWASILPISLRMGYRNLEIVQDDFFTYKIIKGIRHRTWIIIPLDKVAGLKYEKKSIAGVNKNKNKSKQRNIIKRKTDPTERLRRLKKAQEEGLITEDEYQKKRSSILDEY